MSLNKNAIPEFAIVGHPNEGKSSVVSTLSEDDSVVISPTPGETKRCRVFPVVIDGREIIRFIDTPGFQNPKRTLKWFKAYTGEESELISMFLKEHEGNSDFKDDCELVRPLQDGAGIIYVVDGSRPLRRVDIAEMEILRLTGLPRMAILNCKRGEEEYIAQWKKEFMKYFNSVREFNAQNATYNERIALLENLKLMIQDWQEHLQKVIEAFKQDWQMRNVNAAFSIGELLRDCLQFSITENFINDDNAKSVKKRLLNKYQKEIRKIEKNTHRQLRSLYKHNIFNPALPEYSVVTEDLFSDKTWQVLGLRPLQLAIAASTAGGLTGILIDIAAVKVTFGLFAIIGTAAGAGSALLGGKNVAKTKIAGLPIGGAQMRVGPCKNVQLLYILLDRALIYYSYVINWAHSRRDSISDFISDADEKVKKGFTSTWNTEQKKVCQLFFKSLQSRDNAKKENMKKKMVALIKSELFEISNREQQIL